MAPLPLGTATVSSSADPATVPRILASTALLNASRSDRAVMMAALESVSLVTWFDEDTPLELITELRPDVLVKGGDYDMARLAETRVVEGYGGRALAIPFVDGYSTTALVEKIRQN